MRLPLPPSLSAPEARSTFVWRVLRTMLAGRLVAPPCLSFALVYSLGIVLLHARAGWFVVGLGRNGAEYSVLLITCLLAVGLQHVRSRGER